jgi:hypothetical protein
MREVSIRDLRLLEDAAARVQAGISDGIDRTFMADILKLIKEVRAHRARAERTFEEVWAEKIKEGYKYGEDALQQVEFGFKLARE